MALIRKKVKAESFEERIAQTDRARDHAVALADHAAALLNSAAITQKFLIEEMDNEAGRLMTLVDSLSDQQYGNEVASRALANSIA